MIGRVTIALLSALLAAGQVFAKEYLLTGHKPDQIAMIDTAARKVERSFTVPDAGTGISTHCAW